MLVTIRDDTWYVLNMHITPYSKRWDHSDISSGGHKKIKGPVHMVEGGHHLRKPPNPNSQQTEGKWALLKHGITRNALWCNIRVLMIKMQMF